MNKAEFLKALKKALSPLKPSERDRYLSQYDELIADLMESGLSERDAVSKQGEVKAIAAELIQNADPDQLKKLDKTGIVLVILLVILLFVLGFRYLLGVLVSFFFQYDGSAASVGIIGGADGPTAIFLAGKVSYTPSLLVIVTVLVLVVNIIHFVRKRHKKK